MVKISVNEIIRYVMRQISTHNIISLLVKCNPSNWSPVVEPKVVTNSIDTEFFHCRNQCHNKRVVSLIGGQKTNISHFSLMTSVPAFFGRYIGGIVCLLEKGWSISRAASGDMLSTYNVYYRSRTLPWNRTFV